MAQPSDQQVISQVNWILHDNHECSLIAVVVLVTDVVPHAQVQQELQMAYLQEFYTVRRSSKQPAAHKNVL